MINKILILKIISTLLFISTLNTVILYLIIPSALDENKTLIIKQNSSINQISKKLANHGIIKYPELFDIAARLYSFHDYLKSGEYTFTSNISPIQILVMLDAGKSIIHKIKVPEGMVVKDIVDIINNEIRLIGESIGNIPEGFLMPAVYHFAYGDSKQQIINQMKKMMSTQLDKAMKLLQSNSPLKTRMDILILASIIEKETNIKEEKPIIAAVFLNRLKQGMKLQADPTVIYAITKGEFKLARPLNKQDLALSSDYNTYYVKSLPAGPIGCPGSDSINAVVNPADTKALYFVSNGRGGHNFSENIKTHNKYVNEYRKSLKKK